MIPLRIPRSRLGALPGLRLQLVLDLLVLRKISLNSVLNSPTRRNLHPLFKTFMIGIPNLEIPGTVVLVVITCDGIWNLDNSGYYGVGLGNSVGRTRTRN